MDSRRLSMFRLIFFSLSSPPLSSYGKCSLWVRSTQTSATRLATSPLYPSSSSLSFRWLQTVSRVCSSRSALTVTKIYVADRKNVAAAIPLVATPCKLKPLKNGGEARPMHIFTLQRMIIFPNGEGGYNPSSWRERDSVVVQSSGKRFTPTGEIKRFRSNSYANPR